MVIKRLESGTTIAPLRPGGEMDNVEEDPNLWANAKDILGRIYNDYPNIVRVLQEHETVERRRLGSAFSRVYDGT